MSLQKRIGIAVSIVPLWLAVALPASAGFVTGDSLHGVGTDNFFPSTIFNADATIGAGVEFTGTQNLNNSLLTWTADFTANAVTLSLVTSAGVAAFNNPRDTFSFTGIALTGGVAMSDLILTSISNFSLGGVSFGADSLTINLNSFDTRNACCTASVTYAFPTAAVPEPESMTLTGLGLAALALSRRRRAAEP